MSIPDDYGKRRGEGNQDLPAFMRPKDVLALPRRPVNLDQFDAELGTVTREVNQRPQITALEEIAGLILDLRWKELVDLGAELTEIEAGDQAARLWAWAHKTRKD